MIEYVTLDPAEFIDGRVELDLDKLGIKAREVDWGDAEMEVFYIRQELGQIPAERHPPNRNVTMKLRVQKEDGVSLAEAMYKLQQKIGRMNEEGGWIARNMSSKSKFKYKVGFEVYKAVLGGLDGWMLAHKETAPEVTLVMEVSPYCYGPEEIELATISQTTTRDIESVIENAPGTAPGKMRLRIKNNGSTDWFGLQGNVDQVDELLSTNKLSYKCTELTKLGASVEVEHTGATGKTIKGLFPAAPGVSAAVLYSKLKSGFHMTHLGGRRIVFRAYNENATLSANTFYAQLEWRSGAGEWQTNEKKPFLIGKGWQRIDLGEMIASQAKTGTQRCEWRVLLSYSGEAISTNGIYFDVSYNYSQKQYTLLNKNFKLVVPSSYAIDGRPTNGNNENLSGKSLATGGGTWETSGSAKGDFIAHTSLLATRSKTGDTEFRKAQVSSPTVTDGIISCSIRELGWYITSGVETGTQREIFLFMMGGKVRLKIKLSFESSVFKLFITLEGTNVVNPVTIEVSPASTIILQLGLGVVGNKAFAWFGSYPEESPPTLSADLSASEAGKVGFEEKATKALAGSETEYRSFKVYEAESPALVDSGRLFDFGTDGMERQDPSEDVWGSVPLAEGFFPKFPPGGLENRDIRFIMSASEGDYETSSDPSSITNMKLTPYYRPAYHFASEAA